jgi:WhiB family redox-sensing transcriptional regulator
MGRGRGAHAPEWMSAAVCASVDPEIFFPEKGGSTAAAKAICVGCPSVAACLAYAIEDRERYGVWGARSERERRKLIAGQPVQAYTDRRYDEGDCPVCARHFLNVRSHLATKRACREATAAGAA